MSQRVTDSVCANPSSGPLTYRAKTGHTNNSGEPLQLAFTLLSEEVPFLQYSI